MRVFRASTWPSRQYGWTVRSGRRCLGSRSGVVLLGQHAQQSRGECVGELAHQRCATALGDQPLPYAAGAQIGEADQLHGSRGQFRAQLPRAGCGLRVRGGRGRAQQLGEFGRHPRGRLRAGQGLIECGCQEDGVGHALLVPRQEVRLAHLCVAPGWNGHEVAQRLVEEITRRHPDRRGIKLNCRRDYGLNGSWEKLGFVPLRDRPGRGSDRAVLTTWWKDHGLPDLSHQTAVTLASPLTWMTFDDNIGAGVPIGPGVWPVGRRDVARSAPSVALTRPPRCEGNVRWISEQRPEYTPTARP